MSVSPRSEAQNLKRRVELKLWHKLARGKKRLILSSDSSLNDEFNDNADVKICAIGNVNDGLDATGFDTVIVTELVDSYPELLSLLSCLEGVAEEIVFPFLLSDYPEFLAGSGINNELSHSGCSASDLAARLHESGGWTLDACAPYGVFLFGFQENPWLGKMQMTGEYSWQRLISWAQADKEFADLLFFLETSLIACLPPKVARRSMLVLKRGKQGAGDLLSVRERKFNSFLERAGGLPDLAPLLEAPAEEWKLELDRHLGSIRGQILLFFTWSCWWENERIRMTTFLSAEKWAILDQWRMRYKIDETAFDLVKSWHQHPMLTPSMRFQDASLGSALEYPFIGEIITDYFKCFQSAPSQHD